MTDVASGSSLTPSGLPVGDAIDFQRLIWAVDPALQRRSNERTARIDALTSAHAINPWKGPVHGDQ